MGETNPTRQSRWRRFRGSLCEWLPQKDRTLEIVITLFLIALVGIYFQHEDHHIRKEMSEMQRDMVGIVQSKSGLALAVGLLGYLSCTNPPEIRKSAITLLKYAAPTEAERNLREAIVACDNAVPTGDSNFQNVVDGMTYASNVRIFTTLVMHGRILYGDRLWEEAADQWYKAMADLPQDYLDTHKIEWREVQQARDAYEARNYLRAADLFGKAYRNVSTQQ